MNSTSIIIPRTPPLQPACHGSGVQVSYKHLIKLQLTLQKEIENSLFHFSTSLLVKKSVLCLHGIRYMYKQTGQNSKHSAIVFIAHCAATDPTTQIIDKQSIYFFLPPAKCENSHDFPDHTGDQEYMDHTPYDKTCM